MEDQWIEIPKWEEFQHYKNRAPLWIKNYTDLIHKDEYLALTGHQRAVLHGLWIIYASSGCQVRVNTASLTRQLALRVSSATLEALNHAGFIHFVASKPLAQNREENKRLTREEKELWKTQLPKILKDLK